MARVMGRILRKNEHFSREHQRIERLVGTKCTEILDFWKQRQKNDERRYRLNLKGHFSVFGWRKV